MSFELIAALAGLFVFAYIGTNWGRPREERSVRPALWFTLIGMFGCVALDFQNSPFTQLMTYLVNWHP